MAKLHPQMRLIEELQPRAYIKFNSFIPSCQQIYNKITNFQTISTIFKGKRNRVYAPSEPEDRV
jgi:hypothetical protein